MADLVDPLVSADDQPLEVELVGDPEKERHVERVVMGHEGPRRRAPVHRLQHRRLHLEVAPPVQEPPEVPDRLGTGFKNAAHVGVDREIGVALAVAHLRIDQPAVGHRAVRRGLGLSARQGPEALRQELHHQRAHRDLAGFGPKERAGHPDVIVEVEEPRGLPSLAELVLTEVKLDPAARVLEVGEHRPPLGPERHQPPRDGDHRPRIAQRVVVERARLGGEVGPLVAVGVGPHAAGLERRAVVPAGLLDVGPLGGAAHAALPANRLRYACMNSSMSPSITRCTSVTLSSVR